MINYLPRLGAYLTLLLFSGLLLPIPKALLAGLLLVSLGLFLIQLAFRRPAIVVIFLVFFAIPVLAFQIPPLVSSRFSPLTQLALTILLWGCLLSLLVSIATWLANRSQFHLGRSGPSPSDHVPGSLN